MSQPDGVAAHWSVPTSGQWDESTSQSPSWRGRAGCRQAEEGPRGEKPESGGRPSPARLLEAERIGRKQPSDWRHCPRRPPCRSVCADRRDSALLAFLHFFFGIIFLRVESPRSSRSLPGWWWCGRGWEGSWGIFRMRFCISSLCQCLLWLFSACRSLSDQSRGLKWVRGGIVSLFGERVGREKGCLPPTPPHAS